MEELCRLLNQRRKSAREAVTEDDCLRAISKLKVLFLKIYDVYFGIQGVHTLIQPTFTVTPFVVWVLDFSYSSENKDKYEERFS